jgi:hypothetical protein
MREQQQFSHYGPGGRNCVCCGPSPSQRRRHDRMVARRVRQWVQKEIRQQLVNIKENCDDRV